MDFSYEGILASFQERLTIATGGKKTLFLGIVQRIIEAISYILSKFAYYVEYLSTQTVFTKATKREYIIPQSNFLSYTPSRKVAASGYCFISPDSTFKGTFKYLNTSIQKNINNAAAVNVGGGVVGIPLTSHGYADGDKITIAGTVNYNGQYIIQDTSTTHQINILATYLAETFTGAETVTNNVAYDEGSGIVSIPCNNHSMTIGDTIIIANSINYNGTFTIETGTTTNEIRITATYVAENFTGNETISKGTIKYTGNTFFITQWLKASDESNSVKVFVTTDSTYYTNTNINFAYLDADVVTDLGGGLVQIPCTNHSIAVGSTIYLQGTDSYDGVYVTQTHAVADLDNTLVIYATYTAETFYGDEYVFMGHLRVPVKEGTPKTYTYTATGAISETIEILSSTIDNDEIFVDIVDSNGVVLNNVNIVSELYLVDNTTVYSCQIQNKIDFSGIDIKFGDGIRSRKLSSGEFIKISYAETQGVDGDIPEVGKITKINDIVYDSLGNVLTLYITNKKEISDGQDEETIESIQKNAPNLFATGYRAGSGVDWKTIIEAHPQVYKAQVWTNYDLNTSTITATQNIVYIAAISSDGNNLTIEQEADISVNYLKEKRDITDVVLWQVVDILNIKFVITAKINNVSQVDLKNEIKTELSTNYDILNRDFKTGVHESNFINKIDDISDIIYHTTEIYNVEKSKNVSDIQIATPAYTLIPSLIASEESNAEKQIYIVPGSLEIYIQRKIGGEIQDYTATSTFFKIGEDDGAGAINGISAVDIFTPYETYTITGTIDYTTNIIAFNITNMIANPVPYGDLNPADDVALGYFLQLVYKTKDGNGNQTNDIRLPYFYQIIDFDTEDTVFTLTYE